MMLSDYFDNEIRMLVKQYGNERTIFYVNTLAFRYMHLNRLILDAQLHDRPPVTKVPDLPKELAQSLKKKWGFWGRAKINNWSGGMLYLVLDKGIVPALAPCIDKYVEPEVVAAWEKALDRLGVPNNVEALAAMDQIMGGMNQVVDSTTSAATNPATEAPRGDDVPPSGQPQLTPGEKVRVGMEHFIESNMALVPPPATWSETQRLAVACWVTGAADAAGQEHGIDMWGVLAVACVLLTEQCSMDAEECGDFVGTAQTQRDGSIGRRLVIDGGESYRQFCRGDVAASMQLKQVLKVGEALDSIEV